MAKIVICGAGFAGLDTALLLRKKIKDEIIVINSSKNHVFVPSLDEVSAGFLKHDKIIINLEKIFLKRKVDFICDDVLRIDYERKAVVTKTNTVHYDVLVLALGGESDNLAGFDLQFKTLDDSLKINKRFEEILNKGSGTIGIVGAGLSGTELACALSERKNKFCKKKKLNKDNIKVAIIEKQDRILPKLDEKISLIASKFVQELGVKVIFGNAESFDGKIKMKDKELDCDLCVWAAGVRGNRILENFSLHENFGLKVNTYLQAEGFEDIFALGDCMSFEGKKLWTALYATQQAEVVAENVAFFLSKKPLTEYKPKNNPVLLKLGRKSGIFYKDGKVTQGYYAAKLKRFVEKYHLFTRKHGKIMKLLY